MNKHTGHHQVTWQSVWIQRRTRNRERWCNQPPQEAQSTFSFSLEPISNPPNSLLEGTSLVYLAFLRHSGVKPIWPIIFSVQNWGQWRNKRENRAEKRTSLVGWIISTIEKGRNAGSSRVAVFKRSSLKMWWCFLHLASQGHWIEGLWTIYSGFSLGTCDQNETSQSLKRFFVASGFQGPGKAPKKEQESGVMFTRLSLVIIIVPSIQLLINTYVLSALKYLTANFSIRFWVIFWPSL